MPRKPTNSQRLVAELRACGLDQWPAPLFRRIRSRILAVVQRQLTAELREAVDAEQRAAMSAPPRWGGE